MSFEAEFVAAIFAKWKAVLQPPGRMVVDMQHALQDLWCIGGMLILNL